MVVGAKVLWFVCSLYVGILTSPLSHVEGDEQKAFTSL